MCVRRVTVIIVRECVWLLCAMTDCVTVTCGVCVCECVCVCERECVCGCVQCAAPSSLFHGHCVSDCDQHVSVYVAVCCHD